MPLSRDERFSAPLGESCKQNFRVGSSLKDVAFALKNITHFTIVINLATERNHVAAVCGQHRLVSCPTRVDDSQAPVTKADAPAAVVDWN